MSPVKEQLNKNRSKKSNLEFKENPAFGLTASATEQFIFFLSYQIIT